MGQTCREVGLQVIFVGLFLKNNMEIVLVLLPLYAIGYMIMFFKDRWDMFYIKHKRMQNFLSRREYLEGEIKKLEEELIKVESSSLKDKDSVIEDIKKDIKFRKDDLKSFYN